jgi:hypothetical protein
MNLAYRGTTECHHSKKKKNKSNLKEARYLTMITRKQHRRERRSIMIEKCKGSYILKEDIT